MPHVESIEIDTTGEIQNTAFTYATPPPPATTATPDAAVPPSSRVEALERAGREVTKVFKVGRQFRFAVLNPASGLWEDSPAIPDEADAEKQRELAVKRRYEELAGGRG
jgi:NADPH-dependent 2,4-dienoyl-CoA reductase/sulfur reductase-like enzyme